MTVLFQQVFVDALLGNSESTAKSLKVKANKMFNLLPVSDPIEDKVNMNSSLGGLDRLKQSFVSSKNGINSQSEATSEKAKTVRVKRVKPQKVVKKSKK